MRRYPILGSILLAAIQTFAGAAQDLPRSNEAVRPNFIFFLADDMRNDLMGCAGHPILKTPAIDRLASQGVRFERAYVVSSMCVPSRATFWTGLGERQHRVSGSAPQLAAEFVQIAYPTQLRRAGYRTGFVGKMHVGVAPADLRSMFDYCEKIGRNPYMKTMPDGTKRHETDIAADKAIEFLRAQPSNQPFSLQVAFNAPHAEDNDKQQQFHWPPAMDGLYEDIVIPPPPLSDPAIFEALPEFMRESMNRQRWFWRFDTAEKYQQSIKGYFRMIGGVDAAIGRVLETAGELGLADRTVVVFAGDNGKFLGEFGFAGKWNHFDLSLRIPLIVMNPQAPEAARGAIASAMALNADVPATILDLAGIEPGGAIEGRSLAPFTRGETPEQWRTDFFCEHLMDNRSIPKYEGVHGERFVYARYFEQKPPYEFLHDLKANPDQTRNFAGDPAYAATLESMRARCDELVASHGGPYAPQPRAAATRPARQAARQSPPPKPGPSR